VRIKVDENIGRAAVKLLRDRGHDALTVRDQGLGGSADDEGFQACANEGRTLITLDRGFAHAVRFPPEQGAGIVVLELGGRASVRLLHERLREFLAVATERPVDSELWIVEPGRVRVRLRKD
jgi:predicted nuclease of predicted toxin-antitoxin system